MRKRALCLTALFFATLACIRLQTSWAEDWPAFRGPTGDGICRESGLLKQWPKDGPKLLWKSTGLGEGYSSVSVVGNTLYTLGNKDNKQFAIAIDLSKEGKVLWQKDFGPDAKVGFPGSRATPTIDGNYLYTTGLNGEVVCMDRNNGNIIWKKSFIKDFGGKRPNWGFAESVLVDGSMVICTPGGEKNTMVALDKASGKTIWSSAIGDSASYSSPIKAKICDVDQYINLTAQGIISVQAKDGKFLWRYDAPAAKDKPNCSSCIASGNAVFGASAYNNGGGRADITRSGDEFEAKQAYFIKKMQNHHGGMILYNGMVYGANNPKDLMCLDFATGDIKWSDKTVGKGSLLLAEGLLYCRDEKGPISLVEATPDGFKLKGKFEQPDRSDKNSWAYLVIANGKLYVRDQDILLCYDVKEK